MDIERKPSDTSPNFIAAAVDDPLVRVDKASWWINSCSRANVAVESPLFSKGGHGLGLHLPKDLPGSRCPDLFAQWLREHGG